MEAITSTPLRFIKSVKKQLLANGTTKEYIYNQKTYNDKYYENNKDRIQCACGGFYNKSSAYTHRTRVKKHKNYLETLEKPLEILI
jgi:hypothetical protein